MPSRKREGFTEWQSWKALALSTSMTMQVFEEALFSLFKLRDVALYLQQLSVYRLLYMK